LNYPAYIFSSQGQLGSGSGSPTTATFSVTAVDTSGVLGGKVIKTIVPGYQHYVALSMDGQVYTWGLNGYGQLGSNTTFNSTSYIPYPVAVVTAGLPNGYSIVDIAASTYNTYLVMADGTGYRYNRNNIYH
jgi:alpha-tubulin suppressor-like RCC1 family protein